MAEAVACTYNLSLETRHTLALSIDDVTDPTVVKTMDGTSGSLSGSTVPPVTKCWKDTVALAAGVKTMDLTALPNGAFANIDLSGLKVQLVKILIPSGTANPMTFQAGAANGYNIFGGATGVLTLYPGASALIYQPDKLDDVAGGDKNIDVVGVGAETFEIEIVAG